MSIVNGLLLIIAWQSAAPAPSSPPPSIHGGDREMTCPVGGEKFTALVTDMFSSYGERPDGRRYTYWLMPLPLPECPSNKLVLFQAFTDAEAARLAPLIASPEYQALLRQEDTTYYRAQWLATRIGRPEREALWMLLTATWQVKPAPGPVGQGRVSAAKARAYDEEFVRRVRALEPATDDKEYQALWYRAANAQRELGRFAEAGDMLRSLEAWLAGADPGHWGDAVKALELVVARRDASVEPLDAIPKVDAALACLDHAPRDPFGVEFCARAEIRELVERFQAARKH
ncbi:MAG: hypothetical protein JO013_09665 [Alphaproteobacteria bacterium]|nr:hypothetical protein [Alphaproteobacteria bacterium]